MKISYGPPGAVGVKQLQYVGDVDIPDTTGLKPYVKPAAKFAVGSWVAGWLGDSPMLKRTGLIIGLAALAVQYLSKK